MDGTLLWAGIGRIAGVSGIVAGIRRPGRAWRLDKVLGFLDITGGWDPSLALVMIVAIPAAALGYALSGHPRNHRVSRSTACY